MCIKTWKTGGKRFLAYVLVLALLATILPGMVISAAAAGETAITGSVTLANGGNYTLSQSMTGKTITVPNGVTATVTVPAGADVTLNNESSGGAPIAVAAGGNLTLVVNGTLTSYGQHATTDNDAVGIAAAAGADGAYAGVYVANGALLMVKGTGRLNAYGGNGSDGGDGGYPSDPSTIFEGAGGGGGGGAGAGIGGNGGGGGGGGSRGYNGDVGGAGGIGGSGAMNGTAGGDHSDGDGETGGDGGNGGSAGTIYIYNPNVSAYGGNGGDGGSDINIITNATYDGGAGGGGGYPAAGIGGGGAGGGGGGGNDAGGGGGYSGGGGECNRMKTAQGGKDGSNAAPVPSGGDSYRWGPGYGYLSDDLGGGEKGTCDGDTGGAGGAGGAATAVYVISDLTGIVRDGQNKGNTTWDSSSQVIKGRTVEGYGSGAGYYKRGDQNFANGATNGIVATNVIFHDITSSSLTTTGTYTYYVTGSSTTNNITVNTDTTVYLDNVTINMQDQTGKSAIDVKPGASLTLEVFGVNYLYGANGTNGQNGTYGLGSNGGVAAVSGGSGGMAALAVPQGATLNLNGAGTLTAYGGDAGDGGNGNTAIGNGIMRTGGAGGGGAGAGIGGNGGGGKSGNGYVNITPQRGEAGANGTNAGTITINAKVYAYGGSGGAGGAGGPKNQENRNALGDDTVSPSYGGGGGGGGGYPAAGIGGGGGGGGGGESDANGNGPTHGGGGGGGFSGGGGGAYGSAMENAVTAGGINGDGGKAFQGYAHGGAGGGYFAKGEDVDLAQNIASPGGAIFGGGGYYNGMFRGGNGGAGGSGGSITIVNPELVMAQNGSQITTSTSVSQNWAADYATKINNQSSQGYGGGAGFTETNGSVVFMGAPDAPTTVSAVLSGAYGDGVTLAWKAPQNTGGENVKLEGYTVVSGALGINITYKISECTVLGDRVSVTLAGLKSNTECDFEVYANNAKGSSAASEKVTITTKGTPLAPQNAEAHIVAGTAKSARVLWEAPDLGYNDNAITGYEISLIPIGKADASTAALYDILMEYAGPDDEIGQPAPMDEAAVLITKQVGANPEIDSATGKYAMQIDGLHYGTVYLVSISAKNGAGTGEANTGAKVESLSVAATPTVTVKQVKTEEDALTGIEVRWTQPDNLDYIPQLTGYKVERIAIDANGDEIAELGKVWKFNPSGDTWSTSEGLALDVSGEAYAFLDDDPVLAEKRYGYTYTYTVRGVNLAGDGLPGSGSATMEPAAPELTGVSRGVKSLTVAWNAPVNNERLPIRSYAVYRDGEQVGTVEHRAGVASYTYIDKALDNNAEHSYTVRAVNATGAGAVSGEKAASTYAVPDAVNELVPSATAKDKGLVKWTVPSSDGGSPIHGYRVTWKQNGEQVGTKYLPLDQLSPDGEWYSYEITALSQGKTYDVEVVAVNAAGDGTMPGGTFALTTWTTPGIPLNVSTEAIPDGTGNLKVTWSKPATNGGTEINGYYIYVMDGEVQVDKQAVIGQDNTITQLKNLVAGKEYTIYVSAYNSVGEGDKATVKGSAMTAPGAPSPLSADAAWSDKISLDWAEAPDNGSTVTYYRVDVYSETGACLTAGDGVIGTDASGKRTVTYRYGVDNSKELVVTYGEMIAGSTDMRNSLSAVVSGLAPYTNYTFRVRANNTVGLGVDASATARTMSVPFAVQDARTYPVNESGRIEAVWSAPVESGGAPVTGYVAALYEGEITDTEGRTALETREIGPDAERKAAFAGLADGEAYTVVIYAKNKIGDGVETCLSVSPRRPADAPGGVALRLENGTEITLVWSDPDGAGLGGSALTGYVVTLYDKDGNIAATSRDAGGESGISFGAVTAAEGGKAMRVSGLEMGTNYAVSIRVVTDAGDGAESAPAAFKTWALSGPPADLKVQPTNTEGGVLVTWNYPALDGDWDTDPGTDAALPNHTSVTDYKVEYRERGGETWSELLWSAQQENRNEKGEYYISLSGLTNGTTYEVRLSCLNGAGWSEPARVYTATPRMAPGAPAVRAVRTGNGSAVIGAIDLPEDDGGDLITGYKLYAAVAKLVDGNWVPAETPQYKNTVYLPEGSDLLPKQEMLENARVTGLENGVDYIITARAMNGACLGENAGGGLASNGGYVRVGMPEAPTDLRVSLGRGNSIVSRYNAAEGNGSTILYYHVYLNGVVYTMKMENGQLIDTGRAIEFQTLVSTVYGTMMGEEIEVQVSAVNKVGESPLTAPVRVIVGSPTTPEIDGLTMYKDKVNVSWTEAEGNGVVMQGYEVYLTDLMPGGQEQTFTVKKEGNTLPNALDIPASGGDKQNLILGHSYKVQVAARNLAGLSTRSQAKTFTFGVPQAPAITDVAFGTSRLTVTFKAPGDTGGAELTSFMIYANGHTAPLAKLWLGESLPDDKAAEGGWSLAQLAEGSADTYCVVLEGLANGSTYSVQATAWNQYGESDKSDPWSATPATIAGAPGGVKALAQSDTKASLSWTAPAYNGGSEITGYVVGVHDADGNSISTESGVTVTVEGTGATITGLTKGGSYYFTVQAQTKVAELGTAGISNVITTFTNPGQPVITACNSYVQSSGNKYDLQVNWNAPADDGGTEILGYNVYYGSTRANGSVLVQGNSFTITGLAYSRSFNIIVEAVNAVGTQKSESRPVKIGQTGMPVIVDIHTTAETATEGTVYMSWIPPEGVVDAYGVLDLADMNQKFELGYTEEQLAGLTSTKLSDILSTKRVALWDSMIIVQGGMSTEAVVDMLNVGQTYYLALAAYSNTLGFGVPTEVYAVTIGAPGSPVLISAQGTYEALELTWTAPDSLNGFELHGYQVYVNGAAYGDIVPADGAEGTVATTLALENEDSTGPVAVSVTAISKTVGGDLYESLPSNAVTAAPWTNPGTPEELKLAAGNASFAATFRPSDGNGLEIAGYKVYWDGRALAQNQVTRTDNPDGTVTLNVTGVRNGYKDITELEGYPVYVAAYTQDGSGTFYESAAPNPVPTLATGIPAAPEIRSALVSYELASGSNTITLGYVDTETVTGETRRSYEIRVEDTANGKTQTFITGDTSYLIDRFNEAPLNLGSVYRLSVRAENDFGPGTFSKAVLVYLGAPRAPLNVSAIPGKNTATVTWTAPASNAAPISMYKIHVQGGDGSEQIIEIDKNELSGQVRNLTNGVTYTVTVTAWNKYGSSVDSAVCTVRPGAEPGAPASAAALALNDTSIRVTWEPPLDDGGLSVQYYVVENAATGKSTVVNAGQACEAVIDGLERGTGYVFTVKAYNEVGGGPEASTNETATHTLPGKPSWESVSSSDGTIIARWNPPEMDGGSAIVGYTMYISKYDNAGTSLIPVHTIQGIVPGEGDIDPTRGYITYVVPKDEYPLDIGTEYKVCIAAQNATIDEPGGKSDNLSVTIVKGTVASAPGAPTGITAEGGNGEVTLTWNAPSYDGGIGIDTYFIYYRPVGSESYDRVSANSNARSATVTGLTNGTAYEFYVTAGNTEGESAGSYTVTAKPTYIEAPGVPRNLRYVSNGANTGITFQWDAPTSGEGVWYNVYVNNNTGMPTATTEDSFIFLSAAIGTKYELRVEAVNKGGKSAAASIQAQCTLNVDINGDGTPDLNIDADCNGEQDEQITQTVPDAPANVKAAVNGTSSITLTWNAPENQGGDGVSVQNYKVFVDGASTELGPDATSYTLEGITAGKIYSFQVSAVNEIGESKRSDTLQVYVQASTAPSNLRAEPPGESRANIQLSWDAPTAVSQTPAGYMLQVNGLDQGVPITGTSTSYIGELEKTYVFRVYAVYGEGENQETSKTSEPLLVSTVVPTPEAPADVTAIVNAAAEEGLAKSVTVSFSPVENAARYDLYVNGSLAQSNFESGNTYTPETDGVYTIYVVAVNVEGTVEKSSAKSNIVSVNTNDKADNEPDQVMNLTGEMEADYQSVHLSWDPVEPMEGFEISYAVYSATLGSPDELPGEGAFTSILNSIENMTDSGCTVTGLSDGKTYAYQVAAVATPAGGGDGVEGAKSNMVILTAAPEIPVPSAPAGIMGSYDKAGGAITLTWSPNDEAEAVHGYNVYGEVEGVISKLNTEDVVDTTFTWTIPADSDKTAYVFQISAVNATGEGARSAAVNVSIASAFQPTAPDPAVIKTYVFTQDISNGVSSIKVIWTAPDPDANASNQYIEHYKFLLNNREIERTDANFKFDEATGEYSLVLDCGDAEHPIYPGEVNEVSILSVAKVPVPDTDPVGVRRPERPVQGLLRPERGHGRGRRGG